MDGWIYSRIYTHWRKRIGEEKNGHAAFNLVGKFETCCSFKVKHKTSISSLERLLPTHFSFLILFTYWKISSECSILRNKHAGC